MSFSTIKILHIDSNHPLLWEQLQELGFTNHADFTSSKEEIEDKIQEYQGIVIRSRFKIDQTFIDKATNLKFIARVGAGIESIDGDYAAAKNISLIAAPEGNKNAVGEHALGMLLSLFNNLSKADSEIKAGNWNREGNRGHELDGKTVGIIGYGNMGKSFAKKLQGFEVEVLFYDILQNVGDANAKAVSLQELQEKSDVISLHTPWNTSTDKMINSSFINSCAKPFWFINTARGNSVVTDDLVEGLQSGKVMGAALDVLEYEKLSFENLFLDSQKPAAFNYLLQAKNVLLTPHIAGWTFESHEKLAQVIVEKIKSLFIEPEIIEEKYKRVTGIGGFFFKSKNSKELLNWYANHLGFDTNDYGCSFVWKDENGKDCITQWSPFQEDTNYFAPSKKEFMQNFRVHDLEKLMIDLKKAGVTIVGEMETYSYGKFAWILDPEENKIELWEPIDKVFL